jgi:hypothetical protein
MVFKGFRVSILRGAFLITRAVLNPSNEPLCHTTRLEHKKRCAAKHTFFLDPPQYFSGFWSSYDSKHVTQNSKLN